MNCSDFDADRLALGELDADAAVTALLHARSCGRCERELAEARALRSNFQRRAMPATPELTPIRSRIERAVSERQRRRERFRRELPFTVSICASLVLLATVVVKNAPTNPNGSASSRADDTVLSASFRSEAELRMCLLSPPTVPSSIDPEQDVCL